MSSPLVGITTYQSLHDSRRVHVSRAYHEALRRAGARPILIPPGETDLAGLFDLVDAIMLTGGGDVDPELSGAGDHPAVYGVERERDEVEIAMTRAALEREMPIFAICRGMQVVNVALGGTLHAHLPDVNGHSLAHRTDPPGHLFHEVEVDAQSVVARSMEATMVSPASWHHQAVDRLGSGLRVTATAADGTIEAVELDGYRYMAATQWHPEISAHEDPTQQSLFDAFVEWARS